MAKKIYKRAMGIARGTALTLGVAVMLALLLGVATTALAGTGVGARFQLGQTNTVNAITKLVGSVAGPSLRIDNNSTGANATALDLQVEPGKAPMTLNAGTKVTNLNSDTVDGKDSSQFQQAGAPVPQALTLQNGWVKNPFSDANIAAVYKDAEGVVHLEGAIACESGPSGCPNGVFASLPVEFRPAHELEFLVFTNSAHSIELRILPSGSLFLGASDTPTKAREYTSLEGVTFRAVQ